MKYFKICLIIISLIFSVDLVAQILSNNILKNKNYQKFQTNQTIDSLSFRAKEINQWNKIQRQNRHKSVFMKIDSTLSFSDSANPSPTVGLNSKDEYFYDSLNRNYLYIISYPNMGMSTNSFWQKKWKYQHQFDMNDNCIETISFYGEYDLMNNLNWKQNSKSVYTYNSNNLLATHIGYKYDDVQHIWNKYSKATYLYNTSNEIIDGASYLWFNNDWHGTYRTSFTYNSQNIIKTSTYYSFMDSNMVWIETDKTVNQFDTLGILIKTLTLKMNMANMQWDTNYVSINTFDSIGNIVVCTDYRILNNHQLDSVGFSTFLYNQDNYLTEKIFYSYYFNQWFPHDKTEYLYDSLNQILSKREYSRNTDTIIWTKNFRYDYRYDYNYQNQDVQTTIFWVPNSMDENIMTVSSLFIKGNNNSWKLFGHSNYYYSSLSAGIKEEYENINQINIFPNPSFGNFNIDLHNSMSKIELKIYNIEGKIIFQAPYENRKNINISLNIPSGIYFIRIDGGKQGVFTKKILILSE